MSTDRLCIRQGSMWLSRIESVQESGGSQRTLTWSKKRAKRLVFTDRFLTELLVKEVGEGARIVRLSPNRDHGDNAAAHIEGGYIVIHLAIDAIPVAVAGACGQGYIDSPFIVTDAEAFAKDFVHALNEEVSEDGTSRVHKFLDQGFEAAVEGGAQGWVEAVRCDGCAEIVAKDAARLDADKQRVCAECRAKAKDPS
jgi:hypothetical protein